MKYTTKFRSGRREKGKRQANTHNALENRSHSFWFFSRPNHKNLYLWQQQRVKGGGRKVNRVFTISPLCVCVCLSLFYLCVCVCTFSSYFLLPGRCAHSQRISEHKVFLRRRRRKTTSQQETFCLSLNPYTTATNKNSLNTAATAASTFWNAIRVRSPGSRTQPNRFESFYSSRSILLLLFSVPF